MSTFTSLVRVTIIAAHGEMLAAKLKKELLSREGAPAIPFVLTYDERVPDLVAYPDSKPYPHVVMEYPPVPAALEQEGSDIHVLAGLIADITGLMVCRRLVRDQEHTFPNTDKNGDDL